MRRSLASYGNHSPFYFDTVYPRTIRLTSTSGLTSIRSTRHFTPKHASWLNRIECWFSILGRQVLTRGSFTSTDDLAAKIDSYVAALARERGPAGALFVGERVIEKDRLHVGSSQPARIDRVRARRGAKHASEQ